MSLEIDNVISLPQKGIPLTVNDAEIGPIEHEMRAKLAKLKGCEYPDNFDWGIYDKIAAQYESPPRGGVVFNTNFKLVNHHSSCTKCHYSFEIDTYGRGCFHNCVYCYAKDQLTTYRYWNEPQPFPVDLAEIRKIFYTIFETDKPHKWRGIMEKKIPIRMGSMSDSFMWLDTKYGVTKEFLKILKYYKYPYVIFTRSDLVAHDDYIELLDRDLAAIQFSISGNNNSLTRQLEPGAPSYKRRLAAISKLTKAGFWTSVRINPLFPIYPDGYFSDHESIKDRFGSLDAVPKFELYDENFLNELAAAGVPSVLVGFVRISANAVKNLNDSTGINLKPFFKAENLAKKGNAESRYSDAEIGAYYRWFHQMAKQAGIRFSTCYIGMGLKDYFQYQDLWVNKSDCCDIKGVLPSVKKTSQDVTWETRIALATSKEDAIAAMNQEAATQALFE